MSAFTSLSILSCILLLAVAKPLRKSMVYKSVIKPARSSGL